MEYFCPFQLPRISLHLELGIELGMLSFYSFQRHTFLWHLLRQNMNFFPSLRTNVMPLLGYWGLEQK